VRRKKGQLDWAYLYRWTTEFASEPGRQAMTETLRAIEGAL
jgi:hypothetical protein